MKLAQRDTAIRILDGEIGSSVSDARRVRAIAGNEQNHAE
jgi:hypothetical protein